MWNPISIQYSNLFSHVNSEYNFLQNNCVLITGSNETDKNLSNNGAGKTTLFEAICIALTGESLRGVKKDTFINRDYEDCKIVFELNNLVLKSQLKVVRQFFRGSKSSKVEVWEQGVHNTQITSVNEANKRILELIGITREDLLRYYIIGQDNRHTFFTASDADKKEVMNRITSADMVNQIVEDITTRHKESAEDVRSINNQIERVSDKIEVYNEQLQELLTADGNKEEIEDLQSRIKKANTQLKEAGENLTTYTQNITKLTADLKKIIVPDVSELKQQKTDLKKELDALEDGLIENQTIRKNIENELSNNSVVCPECEHEFLSHSDFELSREDAERLLADIKILIEADNLKVTTIKNKIKHINRQLDGASHIEDEVSKIKRAIKNNKNNETDTNDEIEKLNTRISRCNVTIKELQNKASDNTAVQSIESKLKVSKTDLKTLTEELQQAASAMEMLNFWKFNMGRNGFQTYLANKSVKIIEGITNSFLNKFKVDISVVINGFKILKDLSVREKIDVFITNDGLTAEPFMAKSGGERGRVVLAGILGIQHLINLSLDGRGINMLLLDEVFPGVDSTGQESIIATFEKMGITIMMITQNVGEGYNNENTLRVVKENGISKYI